MNKLSVWVLSFVGIGLMLVAAYLYQQNNSIKQTLNDQQVEITDYQTQISLMGTSDAGKDHMIREQLNQIKRLHTKYLYALCMHAKSTDFTFDNTLYATEDPKHKLHLSFYHLTPLETLEAHRYSDVYFAYNKHAKQFDRQWFETHNLPTQLPGDLDANNVSCSYN